MLDLQIGLILGNKSCYQVVSLFEYLYFQLAGVRVKLNQCREELEEAIKAQDFEKAAEVKNYVAELEASKSAILEESKVSVDIPETQR